MTQTQVDTLNKTATNILAELENKEKNLNFETDLSPKEQSIVAFSILNGQLTQGGFLQFLHNGYAAFLLPMIEYLQQEKVTDAVNILDEVLKEYSLHHIRIDAPDTAKAFAQLYPDFPQFDTLEHRWNEVKLKVYQLFFPEETT